MDGRLIDWIGELIDRRCWFDPISAAGRRGWSSGACRLCLAACRQRASRWNELTACIETCPSSRRGLFVIFAYFCGAWLERRRRQRKLNHSQRSGATIWRLPTKELSWVDHDCFIRRTGNVELLTRPFSCSVATDRHRLYDSMNCETQRRTSGQFCRYTKVICRRECDLFWRFVT